MAKRGFYFASLQTCAQPGERAGKTPVLTKPELNNFKLLSLLRKKNVTQLENRAWRANRKTHEKGDRATGSGSHKSTGVQLATQPTQTN